MNTRAAAKAILLALLLPSTLLATRDDARIAEAALRSVSTYDRYTVFDDVSVTVETGAITVFGKVTMASKKEEIGKRLERIDGVRIVRNDIQVLPESVEDDVLRKKIARSIYSSPSFWRYAAQLDPPIHIVIEHGHVTLTGLVGSESDRAVAQSLATGFGERSVTNALRISATERALNGR